MARWIEPLRAELAAAAAFRGCALRPARRDDEDFLFGLHRCAMREYVEAVWGWDEHWQRSHFARAYAPRRQAVIVRVDGGPRDIGRVSVTRHWNNFFLRDIELFPTERNRGIGSAVIGALLAVARKEHRSVELVVLKPNPAQRLYTRLGFRAVDDDGARIRMRAP